MMFNRLISAGFFCQQVDVVRGHDPYRVAQFGQPLLHAQDARTSLESGLFRHVLKDAIGANKSIFGGTFESPSVVQNFDGVL